MAQVLEVAQFSGQAWLRLRAVC